MGGNGNFWIAAAAAVVVLAGGIMLWFWIPFSPVKRRFRKDISALLEEEASSFRGRQLCRRLKPMTDLNKIDTYQEQTAAAFTRIVRKGRISFGDAAP